MKVTDIISSVEESVDHAIAAVGHNIVLGAPLGLGKPVQVMNAFFRRALKDPEINLHIYTALSLELPKPGSHIEANLAGPIVERLFGDYEELDYMRALRAGTLPDNIQVSELYFKAGSMKGLATAQQNYISSNYTHIARDLCDRGINVLVQMVAVKDTEEGVRISLSSNPDTGLDVAERLLADRPDSCFSIAQAHHDMPYMRHDAEVPDGFFDLLVRNPEYDKKVFAVPNAAVPLKDYATAIHASSLIVDGGTLQIGIGSLGDAVAHACIVRHQDSDAYQEILAGLSNEPCHLAADGKPFEEGLYVSTEMFVNGMMHLMEKDIVKRRVYDDLDLQLGLNRGEISERIDESLFDYAIACGLMPRQLDEKSLEALKRWGIVADSVTVDGQTLLIDGHSAVNDTHDMDTRTLLLKSVEGTSLRQGRVLHGGFFLGPEDFYGKLRNLDDAGHEKICMTSVLRTNQLLQDYPLYCAQRKDARFINTGMMVTLAGAVVSDALENGEIVSGVGGQYNFVAMAHDLPGARSILCVRSTRGSDKNLKSNILPYYGHITIPKHLRDVIVTEYGVADLRGQSDSEVIKRLLNVADSRFQEELLEFAKDNNKVEADYEIPEFARHNTPEKIAAVLSGHVKSGLLPDYPFGTALTDQEIALAASLRKIKALAEEPTHFIPRLFKALLHHHHDEAAKPWLERIHLEHPGTSKEFLIQQLLMLELEERGLLKAG